MADRDQVLDYLDAVQLGSALRCGLEDLTMVTHDDAMAGVASQIG